jgi:hypothetical protein
MSAFGPSRHAENTQSMLLGVKQTSPLAPHMSAFDPKRTLSGPLTSLDQIDTMPCPERELGIAGPELVAVEDGNKKPR